MGFEITPAMIGEIKRKNILANFGEKDLVEKAMSKSEFESTYGEGYNVVSKGNFIKMKADALEAGDSAEIIKGMEDSFTPVLVKGVDTVTGMDIAYVRKIEEVSEEK